LVLIILHFIVYQVYLVANVKYVLCWNLTYTLSCLFSVSLEAEDVVSTLEKLWQRVTCEASASFDTMLCFLQ